MKTTILISCYRRPEYLNWHLLSLFRHSDLSNCRVVVLNDGVPDDTEKVAKYYGLDYLFTGHRNSEELQWRTPGYAFNIGIKKYESDIVILTCAEMYHLNDSLGSILEPVVKDEMAIGTPNIYDDHGPLKKSLVDCCGVMSGPIEEVKKRTAERTKKQDPFIANAFMPYFLAMRRERLMYIHGYDEDFTGVGADDNDLMDRLLLSGCHYVHTEGETVHLCHGDSSRRKIDIIQKDERYRHNVQLWKSRKGIMIRNKNREWGVL